MDEFLRRNVDVVYNKPKIFLFKILKNFILILQTYVSRRNFRVQDSKFTDFFVENLLKLF